MKLPRIKALLLVAIFLYVIASLIFALYQEIYGRRHTLMTLLDKNRYELQNLKNENYNLEEQINFYKSPDGLKYLALKDYNMVSKGTKLYKIIIK